MNIAPLLQKHVRDILRNISKETRLRPPAVSEVIKAWEKNAPVALRVFSRLYGSYRVTQIVLIWERLVREKNLNIGGPVGKEVASQCAGPPVVSPK